MYQIADCAPWRSYGCGRSERAAKPSRGCLPSRIGDRASFAFWVIARTKIRSRLRAWPGWPLSVRDVRTYFPPRRELYAVAGTALAPAILVVPDSDRNHSPHGAPTTLQLDSVQSCLRDEFGSPQSHDHAPAKIMQRKRWILHALV